MKVHRVTLRGQRRHRDQGSLHICDLEVHAATVTFHSFEWDNLLPQVRDLATVGCGVDYPIFGSLALDFGVIREQPLGNDILCCP